MASFWDTPFLQSPLKIILSIVLLIIFIVIIVLIIQAQQEKAKNEPVLISYPVSPVGFGSIASSKAPLSVTGRESTYNMWINIRDWDQGYGNYKCILQRSGSDPFAGGASPSLEDQTPANPSIWLYPKENKLMVRVSTMQDESNSGYDRSIYPNYPTVRASGGKYTIVNPYFLQKSPDRLMEPSEYASPTYVCDVTNIPLQRWVQISVVLWNRTLDIYVNGKLVRSCVLPGVPAHLPGSQIWIGASDRSNTFNGYISRLKYFNRACTAEEIYNMYLAGPLSTGFWWEVLKTKAKLTLDIES